MLSADNLVLSDDKMIRADKILLSDNMVNIFTWKLYTLLSKCLFLSSVTLQNAYNTIFTISMSLRFIIVDHSKGFAFLKLGFK
jgi:hypothetical protein